MSSNASRRGAIAAMLVTILIWAYSWVVMKQVLQHAGPFQFSALRYTLGALVLFGALLAMRQSLRPPPLLPTALIGLCQTAAFQGLGQWALVEGGAGRVALLAYTMTDRLAALAVLVRSDAPQAAGALAHFRQRYADNPLALDKWFSVQTQRTGEPALAIVQTLERDAAFTLKNPNRVNSLYGAWARNNPSGFHRTDGAGYRLLAERLAELDALNPQIAARLATVLNGWRRLEPVRRARAREAIAALAEREGLSRNLAEIVRSMLHE